MIDADLRGHELMEKRAKKVLQGSAFTGVKRIFLFCQLNNTSNLALFIWSRISNFLRVYGIAIKGRI